MQAASVALDVDAARALLLGLARRTPTASAPLERALGRFLAQDLRAPVPLPRWPVSVMDGWAVHAADARAGRALPVVGESAAGHPFEGELPAGTCARISTGAVLPAGADAVVPQEDADREGEAVRPDPSRLRQDFGPGTWVRAAGSDVAPGSLLVAGGTRLGPGEIALLGACGLARLPVRRPPKVAILCTGDELVAPGVRPRPGQIVGTNHLMLAAQVREAGAEPWILPPAPDAPGPLGEALAHALDRADLVLTSGGISVGPHDHVRPALEALGAEILFHRLPLRPGRPMAAARRGQTLALALPGNPASTFVTFELFARPFLRACLGADPGRPTARVRLAAPALRAPGREHLVRAHLSGGRATPLATQVSGDLRSLLSAHALLRVPPRTPGGPHHLPAGAEVTALLLPREWGCP